eukprot:Nk52_evm12s157 gene=Nk52_evmTU12s157
MISARMRKALAFSYCSLPRPRFAASFSSSCSSSSSSSKTLSADPDQRIIHLRSPVRPLEIFLIGTAHISTRSAREVHDLIRLVKPDVVAVELCPKRMQQLLTATGGVNGNQSRSSSSEANDADFDVKYKNMERFDFEKGFLDLIKTGFMKSPLLNYIRDYFPKNLGGPNGNPLQALLGGGNYRSSSSSSSSNFEAEFANWIEALLKQHKDQIKGMGFIPGMEFRVAYDEAERLGARYVPVDQDVQVTMTNISRGVITAMARFNPLKFIEMVTSKLLQQAGSAGAASPGGLGKLFGGDFLNSFTRKDVRDIVQWQRETFPVEVVDALLDQRDVYMARELFTRNEIGGRVVCVVGMAHMDGIEKNWEAMCRQASLAKKGALPDTPRE